MVRLSCGKSKHSDLFFLGPYFAKWTVFLNSSLLYNKLVTNLAYSSRSRKYWSSVIFIRTWLRSVWLKVIIFVGTCLTTINVVSNKREHSHWLPPWSKFGIWIVTITAIERFRWVSSLKCFTTENFILYMESPKLEKCTNMVNFVACVWGRRETFICKQFSCCKHLVVNRSAFSNWILNSR